MPDQLRELPPVLRPAPSKLRPPAMGFPFVARPRLLERLREHPARLTFVQAPAGFGKTTFLRHVFDTCAEEGWKVAWLTADQGDNDLDRFMVCLGQAFALANGDDAAGAQWPSNFELGSALERQQSAFMLIIDEFEHVHNPAVLSVIEQMIDMLGPRQRIVIGSREQPLMSVGRLRVKQQLLEIDAFQLRFSVQETSHLLREKRGLPLDGQDIERLHQLTDGWPAALWLSSMALQDNDDPKRFISHFTGSNSVVTSYLAEDVLSHKPKEVQDFILQTSILQTFCADSCNAVTGRSDSRRLLEDLERSSMFVTVLDDQHAWYAYHPLFAGFLRGQLERQSPGLAAVLHRRAALWHVAQQRPVPAIDHALACGDQELTLELLEKHAESLLLRGRVRLLARWLDGVPHEALLERPALVTVYAWSLIHINRSEEALALLEHSATAGAGSVLPHPIYLVLKTLSLFMLDRSEQTAAMWEDPHILGTAEKEPLLRSMLLIGCAYYQATTSRFQEARVMLDHATRERSAIGPLFSITVGGYVHAMLDLMQGRLRAATARLQALIGHPAPYAPRQAGADAGCARQGADTGFASLYLAEALYEADALDEAKRLLKLYLPLVKDAGIPDQLIASHVLHARILHEQGQGGDAMHVLLDLEQLGMQRGLLRIIDMARLERARQATLDGNQVVARDLLALVGEQPSWLCRHVQMVANDIETPALAHYRWHVRFGNPHAILPGLKDHLHDAQARGRIRYAIRVKILHALALHLAGQRNLALRTIKEVLEDAMPEGIVRPFKEEGPLLLGLLRELLDGSGEPGEREERDRAGLLAFMQRMRGEPSTTGLTTPPPSALARAPVQQSDLTSRELDVLVLLAKGHGNQAIAEKLFVSITTVKTHLRNINAKLGAHNRTEAISLARSRCIID
ncbi:LuxR C-terminal-related transcriptional regulator [Noviherbaspirillum galbum]|uniref:HTH luxR-type domain-containing protein n=1 Tax=Noviherbaspirillum galbum TaxID=2709383 RepID=A0A6B3SXU7_9BURK|nr:LuxR C-terminal-related transcriptional regulator [Noviherbaspirillum galbum]NEX64016.1 hypothetical protein [Noviherbaspirillum galbum]